MKVPEIEDEEPNIETETSSVQIDSGDILTTIATVMETPLGYLKKMDFAQITDFMKAKKADGILKVDALPPAAEIANFFVAREPNLYKIDEIEDSETKTTIKILVKK